VAQQPGAVPSAAVQTEAVATASAPAPPGLPIDLPWREESGPPPGPGSKGKPVRRGRLISLAIATALTTLAGIMALVAVVTTSMRDREPEAAPSTTPPAAAIVPGPTDVKLTDERVAVELTWKDPTSGGAAFTVIGAPAGGKMSTYATAPHGATSARVSGLNPTVDYCFMVVAVISVDQVGQSAETCTHRFGATPSR
jgi:hypothetical protein